jgi:hypothetical protein
MPPFIQVRQPPDDSWVTFDLGGPQQTIWIRQPADDRWVQFTIGNPGGSIPAGTNTGDNLLWDGTAWDAVPSLFFNSISWGDPVDGVHDSGVAIRAALAHLGGIGGGILALSPGIHLLDTLSGDVYNNTEFALSLPSNVVLMLLPGCVLKAANNLSALTVEVNGAGLILAKNKTNVWVVGPGTIDCNGANNLVPPATVRTFYTVAFDNCTKQHCRQVTIENSPGLNAIICAGYGQDGDILDNIVHNGGVTLAGNLNQTDFTAIYCDASGVEIARNKVYHDVDPRTFNGGIECHASRQKCHNNELSRCLPGIYEASDLAGIEVVGLQVYRNMMIDCQVGISVVGKGDFRLLKTQDNIVLLKDLGVVGETLIGIRHPTALEIIVNGYSAKITDYECSGNMVRGQYLVVPAIANMVGLRFSGFDRALIHHNQAENLTGDAIEYHGTPIGMKDLDDHDNMMTDYGQNLSDVNRWGTVLISDGLYTGNNLSIRKSQVRLNVKQAGSAPGLGLYSAAHNSWALGTLTRVSVDGINHVGCDIPTTGAWTENQISGLRTVNSIAATLAVTQSAPPWYSMGSAWSSILAASQTVEQWLTPIALPGTFAAAAWQWTVALGGAASFVLNLDQFNPDEVVGPLHLKTLRHIRWGSLDREFVQLAAAGAEYRLLLSGAASVFGFDADNGSFRDHGGNAVYTLVLNGAGVSSFYAAPGVTNFLWGYSAGGCWQFTNAGAGILWSGGPGGNVILQFNGAGQLAFFPGTPPASKPNVVGSKGANAALTSLCTSLATLGLITDSTT